METNELEKLCKSLQMKDVRGAEYAFCKERKEECVGNCWYPTGHAQEECLIEKDKILSCPYRG
jgi:hypothetical protein